MVGPFLDNRCPEFYNHFHECGYSSVVERNLPKVDVRGSSPLTRSTLCKVIMHERQSTGLAFFVHLDCINWAELGQ